MPETETAPSDSTQAEKPRRQRKPRAPKPADAPKPKRTRILPVNTLERRVAAMGEHHAEALRLLSKRDDGFKAGLREEFEHGTKRAAAEARVARAESELHDAKNALHAIDPVGSRVFTTRLDRLAKSIATETGALPETQVDGNEFVDKAASSL